MINVERVNEAGNWYIFTLHSGIDRILNGLQTIQTINGSLPVNLYSGSIDGYVQRVLHGLFAHSEYDSYIRNGLMVQFNRVELGRPNTEAHMQNRKLIAEWCYEKGAADNVIEKKVRDGKTYFVVNDYGKLRALFAELLAEIQRIKSEGDYASGKALVETYAVHIDPVLHKEVKERYDALGLKPYGGFINPEIRPVEKDGKVVDYEVVYTDDYLGQMLEYGHKYGTL